jgi:phosphatidylserine decarboxylase
MKIAQGCISWIVTPFLAGLFFAVLFILFDGTLIGSVCLFISFILLLVTGFFLLFFRDPERTIGNGIVAPADGRIREIINVTDPDLGDCTLISTFMNVYNVHINRMPLDGNIKEIIHISGGYLPAFKKESEKNERVVIVMDTKIGTVKIVQIAGTLARRIVPYVKKGDERKKGDKIGIIRFGSRVDIYIPTKKIKRISVNVNDRIKAGEDAIAEIDD